MAVEEDSAKGGLKGCTCSNLDCRGFSLECDLESLARDGLCIDMQLTQPPVVQVELFPFRSSENDIEIDLENSDGVRIGEVITALRNQAHFGNGSGGLWWLRTPGVCVVSAAQMQSVEHMRVVPDSLDPWLEKSRQ
ncbi:hypothetical protein LTR17_021120 [Elasticomyces elasticus]|nr:hypothetical protein LTR17_021120 [Elasticomyces elasticus]